MILWDIASGERLKTFEGHDRGLACIEFKVKRSPDTPGVYPKLNCPRTI